MGARHKLNEIFFGGSIVFAALVGLASQSWSAFALVLAVLLVLQVAEGNIRPSRR